MPAAMVPEVLANPIGVVIDLVVGLDKSLDRAVVTNVVERIAGGRAKQRRLAQALLDKPTVLDDGRSPAPRAVADLLIALRKSGAPHLRGLSRGQMGRPHARYRQRGPLGASPLAAARSHRQTRRSCRRAARAALRPMAIRDQPSHARARRAPPRPGAAAAGP